MGNRTIFEIDNNRFSGFLRASTAKISKERRRKEGKKEANPQQVRNTLTHLTELTRSSSNKPISKEPKPLSGNWFSKVLLVETLASLDRSTQLTRCSINNNGSVVDRLIREVGRVPVAYR